MPVTLNLTEYEAGLVMDALMEGRWALMKQWGNLREIEEDHIFPGDMQASFENLDENVVALGWVRDRLKRAIIETPPDGGKIGAVWHHKRGWIRPVDEIRKAAAAVESGKITREDAAHAIGVDLAEVDAENARDQDRLKVNGWTVLPQGFEVTFEEPKSGYGLVGDLEDDTWPYENTEADDPVTAGVDTQATADGKVRIDIQIGGKTVSVTGDACALKTLSDLGMRL